MKLNDAPSFDIIKGMTYLEEDRKGGEEAGEKEERTKGWVSKTSSLISILRG